MWVKMSNARHNLRDHAAVVALERIEEQYGKVRRVWLMDRGVPLPLPKTLEQAILRPTTSGNPRNVGFYRAAAAAIKSDRSERTIWILRGSFS